MALIKCPECGKEISDKAGVCPHCGCPVEKEKDTTLKEAAISQKDGSAVEEKETVVKSSKKKILIIVGSIIAFGIVCGICGYYFTQDMRAYNKATKLYERKEYQSAADEFLNLEDYKDSEELYKKSIYELANEKYVAEKYDEAKELFWKLQGYEDSDTLLADCEYLLTVDGQFMNALSKGLMKRWDYAEIGYKEDFGNDDTKISESDWLKQREKCATIEIDAIGSFQDKTFEDVSLKEKYDAYMETLDTSIKAIDYYYIDLAQYTQKWDEAYANRSVLIRSFVDDYGLKVDETHQVWLDEFITNASVVDEQEAVKTAVKDMTEQFELTPKTDEWGNTTYRFSMENTTEYDFDYFYVDISALDADGNIIGTGNASQISNWLHGQKAEVDAWVQIDDASKIVSLTYKTHYQTGNYYE